MGTKSVALFTLCFFLCLQAASAQSKPLLKEIEMSSRKLLILATAPVLPAAHDGTSEHGRLSLADSFVRRIFTVILLSLFVIVAGILCRLWGQNPRIQYADETVRPNITYNFIGSCFSVN